MRRNGNTHRRLDALEELLMLQGESARRSEVLKAEADRRFAWQLCKIYGNPKPLAEVEPITDEQFAATLARVYGEPEDGEGGHAEQAD